LIFNFGWIRAAELANILWPKTPSKGMRAAQVLKRLFDENFVIKRALTTGLGNAYLLSKKGAQWLNENNVTQTATTGRFLGDKNDGVWSPSVTFEHDLMATSFLTLIGGESENFDDGSNIVSEFYLSRKIGGQKIPDGLLFSKGKWWAIEVERAAKTGINLKRLVDSMEHWARGSKVGNFEVSHSILVFEEGTQHKNRFIEAMEKHLKPRTEISIVFAECKLKNFAVVSYKMERVKIKSKHVVDEYEYSVLKRDFGLPKSDGTIFLSADQSPFTIKLSPPSYGDGWFIYIMRDGKQVGQGIDCPLSMRLLDVKGHAKQALLGCQQYKEWFDNSTLQKEA